MGIKPEIIEVEIEEPSEETDEECTTEESCENVNINPTESHYEGHYTEEEIIELCSLLSYERGEYSDWIKIGTALKNGGYDWSVFEEISKNLKNYDSMCNFAWKFRSLDETRGNLGTIVNMVKEDSPDEYYEWKMRRRSSLFLTSIESEVKQTESDGENNENLDCEDESDVITEYTPNQHVNETSEDNTDEDESDVTTEDTQNQHI